MSADVCDRVLWRGLFESGNTENILSLMHVFMYNGRTILVYWCACAWGKPGTLTDSIKKCSTKESTYVYDKKLCDGRFPGAGI